MRGSVFSIAVEISDAHGGFPTVFTGRDVEGNAYLYGMALCSKILYVVQRFVMTKRDDLWYDPHGPQNSIRYG